MNEMKGDLWKVYEESRIIVITTNGAIRHDGAAIMGRGVALEAAKRFETLPFRLGNWISAHGNIPHYFENIRVITMPVKHHWQEKASLELIAESAARLMQVANGFRLHEIYLPRPGCGNGSLEWRKVKPVIEPILDDRFTVVEYEPPLQQLRRTYKQR